MIYDYYVITYLVADVRITDDDSTSYSGRVQVDLLNNGEYIQEGQYDWDPVYECVGTVVERVQKRLEAEPPKSLIIEGEWVPRVDESRRRDYMQIIRQMCMLRLKIDIPDASCVFSAVVRRRAVTAYGA